MDLMERMEELELLDPQVKLDPQALLEFLDTWALVVHKDPWDPLVWMERMVPLVWMLCKVLKGLPVLLVLLDPWVHPEKMVMLEQWALLVQMERMVCSVLTDLVEKTVWLVLKDPWDPWDLLVWMEKLVMMDTLEFLDLWVKLVSIHVV
jgi:hypothetical protein